MSQEEQYASDEDGNKSEGSAPPDGKSTLDEKKITKKKTTAASHKNKNPDSTEPFYTPIEKKIKWIFSKWKIPDKINGVLVVFTAMLFFLNYCGLSAADKSAQAAQDLARIQNTQFIIQNKPSLAIGYVSDTTPQVGKRAHFYYNILNLGIRPVHVYYFKTRVFLHPITSDGISDSMKLVNYSILNGYIGSNTPMILSQRVSMGISTADSTNIMNGDCFFYANFLYDNDVTSKWRAYTIIVSIKPDGGNSMFKAFYNENTDTCIVGIPYKAR